MIRFLLLVTTAALAGLVNPVFGQTTEQMILLQNNPRLAEKIYKGTDSKETTIGVPTSDNPKEPNEADSRNDPNIIVQSTAQVPKDNSVIQRYYRVLSEETLSIYGISEFSQKQNNNLLFFNTIGKNYQLAAGDVVRVTIRGRIERDSNYKVGRDGNLILPNLAPVSVSGITIAEVESKLLDILRFDDVSASVFVSLETARLVTVQISGAVESPRTLAVPAYTPLSRILAYSGGIAPTGSLRNIVLRDQDGNTEKVDFYDFLQNPAGANDPLITQTSRIFVGNQGKTIGAIGFVARPGIYELQEGRDNIPVAELLQLTGTSVVPPGTKFEALFFDNNGITRKRQIDRSGFLAAGEVLDLRFVETTLQGSIEVVGAVLNEYKIATTKPMSLKELLKTGDVLKKDIFNEEENAKLDFSLLISKNGQIRTISIRERIKDSSFLVLPDTKLVVLSSARYKSILRDDPKSSSDPLLDVISRSDRVELYVDGEKVAIIPPSRGRTFADIMKYHYNISPNINLDLAIIESSTGGSRSVALKQILATNEQITFSPGEKIHLFTSKILSIPSPNPPLENYNDTEKAPKDLDWKDFKHLFNKSNVIQVKLDNKLIGFLPQDTRAPTIAAADIVGFENTARLSDLILIESKDIKNGNSYVYSSSMVNSKLTPKEVIVSINLFRPESIKNIIKNQNSLLFSEIKDTTVSLYIDFNLVIFSAATDLNYRFSKISRRINNAEIYPLFAIHKSNGDINEFSETTILTLAELARPPFVSNIQNRDEIFIFTNNFIRELSSKGIISSESFTPSESEGVNTPPPAEDLDKKSAPDSILTKDVVKPKEENVIDRFDLEEKVNYMKSYARFIGGAVGTPGAYPSANTISLAQLIAVAGGTTANSNIQETTLTMLKVEEGRIVPDKIRTIDLNTTQASEVMLSGMYNVFIPPFINDAATGVVTLVGEVERPGQYVIQRDETLHDVIDRAGGFSSVAYPLGAIFTRESLKAAQKEGNDLLARQVEEAVLKISQSEDKTGVGEQITAVLSYAKQLRQQEVSGRLTVNVLQRDKAAPVYMQNGDILTIPKRPGHVSVIGSVQKNTVSSYSKDKRLSAYLASAGGINRVADRSQTYIVLPNGESDSVDNNSVIPPGSVIVVPPKTDRLSALSFTETVSRILGNIALSVLAINNAR